VFGGYKSVTVPEVAAPHKFAVPCRSLCQTLSLSPWATPFKGIFTLIHVVISWFVSSRPCFVVWFLHYMVYLTVSVLHVLILSLLYHVLSLQHSLCATMYALQHLCYRTLYHNVCTTGHAIHNTASQHVYHWACTTEYCTTTCVPLGIHYRIRIIAHVLLGLYYRICITRSAS